MNSFEIIFSIKMSNKFEKDLEQFLSKSELNQDTMRNVATKIFVTPFHGGIDEGLGKCQNQISHCLNGKCKSKDELYENTNYSMHSINDWLSMIIAQNVIQKIKGKNFLDERISDGAACPYKTNRRKSPRKKHQGTRY